MVQAPSERVEMSELVIAVGFCSVAAWAPTDSIEEQEVFIPLGPRSVPRLRGPRLSFWFVTWPSCPWMSREMLSQAEPSPWDVGPKVLDLAFARSYWRRLTRRSWRQARARINGTRAGMLQVRHRLPDCWPLVARFLFGDP